jgi:hypothetical protein
MKLWTMGFGVLLSSACGALFLTQCGDSNFGTPQDGGLGSDAAGQCPTNPPTSGTACSLPNGTLCNNYPQPGCECCAGVEFECDNGTWQGLATAGSSPAQGVCPATVPEAGTPCSFSTCGGPLPACPYDCVTGNGAVSTASCPSGAWVVQQSEVSCPVDGGAPDADAGDGG